mgnify:CR=1 FL=1
MELNVFDLFESEAELELKRSDLTGSLMPNKLYFYAGSSVAKVPLVPPVDSRKYNPVPVVDLIIWQIPLTEISLQFRR